MADAWFRTPAELIGADGSPFERTIVVPFPYQSSASGIGDRGFHDVVWYARTFDYPDLPIGTDRVLLHFGAVDYRAQVWVNGVAVTIHEGGHTPFSADITDALTHGENGLIVRVEDPSTDPSIPRGKQYWREESKGIFYTRTTGIWQTVWLEPVNQRRIDRVRVTPDLDGSSVRLEVDTAHGGGATTVRTTISRGGRHIASAESPIGLAPTELVVSLHEDHTGVPVDHWSPDRPALYDLNLELLDGDGSVLDEVDSYFGMRKIEAKNGRVHLNNEPYFLRLILDQGYYPEGLLTAPTDDAIRADVELTKAMGFNGARKHQTVPDPRWLYWADTLGILVWGEMANAFHYTADYVRRITAEWQDVVQRDYNSPSIVAWVPINETMGARRLDLDTDLPTGPINVPHLDSLYHLTRSLDASRLVLSNDGWEHATSDLCTIHDYSEAEKLRARFASVTSALNPASDPPVYAPGHDHAGQPIVVTEFGGILTGTAVDRIGYAIAGDADELLRIYDAMVRALVESDIVAGFCYTQLTDVEQEINGLLTPDRKPKADLGRLRAITTQR